MNALTQRAHSRKGGGGAIADAANRQAENVRQHDRAQQDDERVGDGLVRRALVEDRRADVTEDRGWVVLEMDGPIEEIERGLDWVAAKGVRVDPVPGDIVEGWWLASQNS